MDNESDYKGLIEGQYYNHFQNNKELTTKIGLTNNLKEFCEYGANFDQFYPRCYDLGNNKELMEFTADFEHTNMMILFGMVFWSPPNFLFFFTSKFLFIAFKKFFAV